MDWLFTPYTLLLLASGVMSIILATYAWQRRSVVGAPLIALLLAAALWSLGYAMEIETLELPGKLFWAKFQYLGITVLPLSWLIFALQYTRRTKWLTRRNMALLFVIPSLTLLLVWTNEAHGLIWPDSRLIEAIPGVALDLKHGLWFWFHLAFAELLLLLGTGILTYEFVQSAHLYRRQFGVLLFGVLTPWIGNILYVSGFNPFAPFDLTPFAFTLSGLALGWGLFRFHLLDITPIAHRSVVENINVGVIALDAQNRIIELNPVGEQLIGVPVAQAIGRPIDQLMGAQSELLETYRDASNMEASKVYEEIVLGEGETQRHCELNILPFFDRRSQAIGRLVTLYDITQRKQVEEELRIKRRQAETLRIATQALSSSLDLAQVFELILGELQKVVPYDSASVQQIKGNTLEIIGGRGFPDLDEVIGIRFDLRADDNPNRQIIATGEALILHDPDAIYPKFRAECYAPTGVVSWLGAPLLFGDKSIGMLAIEKQEPGFYKQEHARLAMSFATQAAIAIENARLYKQVRQHSQSLKQLVAERTAELRRSEERTRLIIEHALDAIITADEDGQITDWNPQAEAIFGWPRREIIGQTLANTIVPPRYRELHIQRLNRSLNAGESSVFNKRIKIAMKRRDGYEFPAEMAITPVKLGSGIAFNLFARDITEQARAEESLARSVQEAETLRHFVEMINSSLDASTVLNTMLSETSSFLQVDASSILLVDRTTQELVFRASTNLPLEGEEGLEIRMPLDQGIAGRAVRLKKTQIIDDIERDPDYYRFVADAAQIQVASMLVAPMIYKDEVRGVIEAISSEPRHFTSDEARLLEGIAQSTLTALNNSQLHQHLLDSEAKYRALFENAADFIWTTDLKGRFTAVNRAAESIIRLDKAEIIGHPLDSFIIAEQQEAARQAMEKVYTAGVTLFDFPVKILTGDGRQLDLELSASALRTAGTITGLQGIARDVTRRLQMERELLRSEKLAATGRLAAGVAHEVNNPLAIISSTIQLMMYKWDADNPDRELLRQIEEEIQRISRILKGLMDFARPTSRRAAPQYLDEIIENFIPLLKGDLQKHNIELDLQLTPNLPPVIIRQDEIKQVLFNLVSNARDAMPEGGRLTITTEARGQTAHLQISDTGVGLSPEVEEKLFEPFFSTKGVTGNGLGLATVHGIISAYGGVVKAANNPGPGCVFSIDLPIAEGAIF